MWTPAAFQLNYDLAERGKARVFICLMRNKCFEIYVTSQCYSGGNLLKTVPCISVWHQNLILKNYQNSSKLALLYSSNMASLSKNKQGHLQTSMLRLASNSNFWGCHTLTFCKKKPVYSIGGNFSNILVSSWGEKQINQFLKEIHNFSILIFSTTSVCDIFPFLIFLERISVNYE